MWAVWVGGYELHTIPVDLLRSTNAGHGIFGLFDANSPILR